MEDDTNINLLNKIIACPKCRGLLEISSEFHYCDNCKITYHEYNGKINFLINPIAHDNNTLNQIKNIIKKFPIVYKILSEVVAPVHISKKTLKKIIQEINDKSLLGLNIGSGITNYSTQIINFDLQQFANVNVIGDLFSLPFRDNTFDYVFSIYVLEHVPNPELAIKEMHRVLKPGGICYSFIPFIQGFHAAPNDYVRFTSSGVVNYFYEFDIIKNKAVGPTSAALWIVQEWLAIILSFNSRKLHLIIHTIIMFISFPIKYLDIILSKSSLAKNIASVNEIIARKKYY